MQDIVKTNVKRLWLVGKVGSGLVLMPDAPVDVQVCFKSLDDQVWHHLDILEQRLTMHLGRLVRVSVVRKDFTPDRALEIFIPKASGGGGGEAPQEND